MNSYGTTAQKDLDKFSKLQEEGLLGWLQIYILPDTNNSHIQKFCDRNFNIIIHAAHGYHGLNFEKGLKDINIKIIDEAFKSADKLSAPFLIFHPCYTSNDFNMSYEEMKENDYNVSSIYEYVFRNKPEKTKILIENMPLWIGDKKGIFNMPVDPILDFIKKYDFGVCLDLATIALNANFFPNYLLYPPETKKLISNNIDQLYKLFCDGVEFDYLSEDYLRNKERHQIEMLNEFMTLDPDVFHTRGIGFSNLARTPRYFTKLNYLQLA